jgi:hypothetical protein
MLKPVFVPKDKRGTIFQREELEEEAQRIADQEAARLQERKEESKVKPPTLMPMCTSKGAFVSHRLHSQLLLAKELAARSATKT